MPLDRVTFGHALTWTTTGRRGMTVHHATGDHQVTRLPAATARAAKVPAGWYLHLPDAEPWWVGRTIREARACSELRLICPWIAPDAPGGVIPNLSRLTRGVPAQRGGLLVRPVESAGGSPSVLGVSRAAVPVARVHVLIEPDPSWLSPTALWRAVVPGEVDVWCERWDEAWSAVVAGVDGVTGWTGGGAGLPSG